MYFKIAPFRAGELILMKLLLADFADKADFKHNIVIPEESRQSGFLQKYKLGSCD